MLAGRGRGAAASSYVTQAWIERSRHEGRPSGGFTLDLIKCYNQVPRPVATILLKRVGMPPEWVTKWSQALKDLRRLWQISNSLSSPRHSTTGIPEGCPISCIAMVALSSLWCKLLRRHNTVPSAYADNWAWKSEDATRHRPAMATTVEFTKSVRLPISFEKSTWWATGREHEQEWQALLRETLPEEQISRVKRVIDLGNPLTFQGYVSSASIDDRFQKAAVKCTRLQRSDEPPDTKAAILLRNIWPTAMYGSPLVMVPEGKLSSLRTKAADAVLGGPNAGNSAITLAFAGNNIADPELYYFTEVFREARRYLLAADSDSRASFYAIVVASRGKAGKVWGPAGILAQVLIRLTWTCNREGAIGIGAFETLRLELESFEVVKAHLRRAWEGDLLSRFSVNPAFRNALPVDTLATWAALQAFEPGEKALLIRDITGAFQTQDRKAKWAHDATPTCEYCPEPDSISHRLLHCQAFSECRQPFENVVTDLLQKDATDLVLPVIHRDPGQDFLRVTHISHRELEIDPHTQAVADSLQSIPHWYVDGSCAHPESPACYSTCAAILDTLTCDEERQRAVDGLRSMQDLPDTFLVGGFARVQGDQHIYRAEMHVVVRLLETQHRGHIWSDSQLVCDMVDKCRVSPSHLDLQHHTNYDLVRRMWFGLRQSSVTIEKIKAHQDRRDMTSALQVYRSCGNDIADATAREANRSMTPGLTQMYREQVEQRQEDISELRDQYRFRVALARARLQGNDSIERMKQGEASDMRAGAEDLYLKFLHWKPSRPRPVVHAICPDCTDFAYGCGLGQALWTWISRLHIGDEAEGPLDRSPGTSWLELCMGFMATCRVWIPVRRIQRGNAWYVLPTTEAEARNLGCTWAEQANIFSRMVQALEQVVELPGWPKMKRSRVPSSHCLGGPSWAQGLDRRIIFPGQDVAFKRFRSDFNDLERKSYGYLALWEPSEDEIDIEWGPEDLVVKPLDWKQAWKKHHAWKERRAVQRARGGA